MLQNLWLQVGKAMAGVREREDGQALVEYALILFLVSVVAVGTLKILGGDIKSVLSTVTKDL
jgi:Flp pilus assembly pilin Flp